MSTSPSSPVSTREPSRRFPGPVVAIGLAVFILLVAAVAWIIHKQNIWARSQAREAAEAAEAAEREGAPAPTAPSE